MTEQQKKWKKRLGALGLSQAGFANMIGLRYADMCLYINCKRQPVAQTFVLIENALKNLEDESK